MIQVTDKPIRILVVKLTSMGDVLHVLPALTDLQQAYPNAVVDWLVEDSFSEIPTWHPLVNQVVKVSTRRWRKLSRQAWQQFCEFRQILRAESYDVVVDAQGLIKSALLCRMARLNKGGQRIGFCGKSIKESPAAWFYGKRISVDRQQHAITRVRQLFAQAFDYDLPQKGLDYQVNEAVTGPFEAESSGLTNVNSKKQQPYVILLHGTTWQTKHLPDVYWQNLVQLAVSEGYQIKLVWGNSAEKKRADWIAEVSESVDVLPKLPLIDVAKVLKNAAGVIAVDTGLGHLSAALSVPCVSVYGATNAELTGAVGDNQQHIQTDYVCSPCLKKQCDQLSDDVVHMPCYQTLQASTIWQSLQKLMSQ